MSQSFFSYNEFRAYDFLLILLIALLLLNYRAQLKAFLHRDRVGRRFYQFCLWASATYPLTLIVAYVNNDPGLPFVTFVFLFHLWGFMLAYAGFRMFVTTRKQCLLLLDLFLVIGATEALIICGQALGLAPRFWSSLYDVYGEMTFSATLGPNRQLPGHSMLLVFVVATAYWRNAALVRGRRLFLAAGAAMLSLLGLGLSGSRTAWAAFIVFMIAIAITQRQSLKVVALVVVLIAGFYFLVPSSINKRFSEMYDYRITRSLAKSSSDDPLAKFQSVDAGRYELWNATVQTLFQKPWLIPFGGGFNTFKQNTEIDVSAHNTYLNLIAEVGIVGLALYLMWLYAIWRESEGMKSMVNKRPKEQSFQPGELKALTIALMVSIFAGEILSTRRPAFAFLGMFLFLVAVMNHRALILGTEQSRRSLLLQLLYLKAKRAIQLKTKRAELNPL